MPTPEFLLGKTDGLLERAKDGAVELPIDELHLGDLLANLRVEPVTSFTLQNVIV